MNTSLLSAVRNAATPSVLKGIALEHITVAAAPTSVMACAHYLSAPGTPMGAIVGGVVLLGACALAAANTFGKIGSDVYNAATSRVEDGEDMSTPAQSHVGDFVAKILQQRNSDTALLPKKPRP